MSLSELLPLVPPLLPQVVQVVQVKVTAAAVQEGQRSRRLLERERERDDDGVEWSKLQSCARTKKQDPGFQGITTHSNFKTQDPQDPVAG